jgi:[protein-PII] uridylyltransferase
VGRRIAEEMAMRLLLRPSDGADLAFLVHRHLVMSHLAFRRDTNDRELVRRFAADVATPTRLRMLFALTCADLAAVGPDVLTKWKAEVLSELYSRTLAELEHQPSMADADLAERRKQVAACLTKDESRDGWFQRQIEALPSGFLATRPAKAAADALRRFRKLPPRGTTAWGEYNAEARTVEFTAGVDQGRGRGALSSMAGALSSSGMEILAAATQILADDLLLLRYTVLDPDSKAAPPPHRLEQVARLLAASVDSTEPPRFRRLFGQDQVEASRKLTALPNDVRIDNRASADATVVEVFTFDRTGLLYSLARKLHELELTIWHAKIGTYIDQVVDVFYVTNRGGGKIEDTERLEQIRRELFAVIDAG